MSSFSSLAAQAQQARRLLRHDARLLRLLAGVDLDEELQRLPCRAISSATACGDLRPVDGVNRIEQLDRLLAPCWTAAGRSGAARSGKALAQRRPLGLGLLHAVLAEPAMAGVEHGRDLLRPRRSW